MTNAHGDFPKYLQWCTTKLYSTSADRQEHCCGDIIFPLYHVSGALIPRTDPHRNQHRKDQNNTLSSILHKVTGTHQHNDVGNHRQ